MQLARAEVEATLDSLPPPLRAKARTLPVTCQSEPSPALVEDGIELDTLGLFVGEAYPDEERQGAPMPPQIILFLDNLWDYAEADDAAYRAEIRTTLLHELGHFLGLDETDLEKRGLE